MRSFVSFCLEIEVVLDAVVAALASNGQDNLHVELAPSFLVDPKRWLLEDLIFSDKLIDTCRGVRTLFCALLETRMQIVGHLLVHRRRHLRAVGLVEDVYFYRPVAHGEAFDTGIFLGAVGRKV